MLGCSSFITNLILKPLTWQEPQQKVNRINGRAMTRSQLTLRSCKWISISSRNAAIFNRHADKDDFSDLYKKISYYCEKVMLNDMSESVKSRKVRFLEQIIESLNAFEKNNIPERCPDHSVLHEDDIDSDMELKEIIFLFHEIRFKRTCLSLDKRFLNELSKILKSKKCIEVYAGNGWLSDELRKNGINIRSSDLFTYPDEYYNFKRNVESKSAPEAAVDFIINLSNKDCGCILLAFPEGIKTELMIVFKCMQANPNCSIIAIGLDETEWSVDSWKFSNRLISQDMTEVLKYSPSRAMERVVLYSMVST